MNPLHGIWWRSRFHLWGERGDAASTPDLDPSAGSTIRAHPCALNTAELHTIVGDLSPDGLLTSVGEETTLVLWLPVVDRESTALPGPSPTGTRTVEHKLVRVRVPTLAFTPADAIDLLTGPTDPIVRTSSASLRYWAGLAEFVLSLLARRQFAPDMEDLGGGQFQGVWRLFVHDTEEVEWLSKTIAVIPPVCLAVASSDSHRPDSLRVVDGFLFEAAEALIRRYLGSDDFFRQIHTRAEAESGWEVRWLSGLIGERRPMTWNLEENPAVFDRIRDWLAPLDTGPPDEPVRLEFTLNEPPEPAMSGEAAWKLEVRYSDPVSGEHGDVTRFLTDTSDERSIFGNRRSTRRSQLASELSRAAQILPDLEGLKSNPAPSAVAMTTEEAHRFILEWAPLLQAQGFDVALPAWAANAENRLGMHLILKPQQDPSVPKDGADGQFGLNCLIDFDWRIAIGNEQITAGEFEEVLKQDAPLVRVRGHWVGVDRDAALKAIAFLRRQPASQMTLGDALRLWGGAQTLETGLPILRLSGGSWIRPLLAESPRIEFEEIQQPARFYGQLRPYQLRGLGWLTFLDRLGLGACLADDMGLGKTVQLIALLLHERIKNPNIRPTLLLVPMSLLGNWEREIQRFAPSLKALVHHGPARLPARAFLESAPSYDIVITTYGLAHRELRSLQRVRWHRIALDEAQKIKNPSASQTIAVRSLSAPHRVALTGTPLENHLSELWSIIEVLNPGLLGTAGSFRRKFSVPIEKMGDRQRAEQLRRLIRPFMLRRLKSDPDVECDLPEKMEMRVFCNLTPEQARHYESIVRDLMSRVDSAIGINRRGYILAALTRLKQVCNHPAQFLGDDGFLDGRSGKCERLCEMLEEVLEEGDAALVFTQYRRMGELLERMIANRLRTEALYLHGGTPQKERDRLIQRFQDPDSRERIFVLSLRAGGFGLNLTRANHVFHFDRWWNPAIEDQATDRAHRIGQIRRVQVHKFVCIGTIEERIDQGLEKKAALADRIVGSGDDWLTNLSTEELRETLKLSQDAVAEAL